MKNQKHLEDIVNQRERLMHFLINVPVIIGRKPLELLSEVEEMKNKEQTNACYGCFGAANGDCDECAKDWSDKQ